MVEAHKQPREVFRLVGEQQVDAFGQEAFGVGVQAKRVKESAVCELFQQLDWQIQSLLASGLQAQ